MVEEGLAPRSVCHQFLTLTSTLVCLLRTVCRKGNYGVKVATAFSHKHPEKKLRRETRRQRRDAKIETQRAKDRGQARRRRQTDSWDGVSPHTHGPPAEP